MYRFLRSLALAGTFAGVLTTTLTAQSQDALPALPDTYFPQLRSILDTALQQSPRMVSRNMEIALAEQNHVTARAGQLPSLGGYLTYYPWDRQTRADLKGSPTNPKGVTDVKRLSYSISITQPLFHWGALKNATRISELNLKIAQGQTAEAYRLLAEEIRAQYLALIIKKAYLARARFNQEIADHELTLARAKLEKHVIADADMFSPTISAEQARLITDHNESDYEYARTAFGKLYGAPALPDDQIPTEIPAVTPAYSAIQQLSGENPSAVNSFALENAERGIEVERLNYKIASTRLLPKFSLVAGLSQDQQSYSINPGSRYQVQDMYAGATVSWTIFDGFAARAAKKSSLIRRRQLERAYEEQTADLSAGLKRQIREIEFSARNLAIVEKLFASATAYIRIKQEDQKRGLAAESEVQAARLGYQDSQLNAFTARADYLMKVADYVSAIQKDPVLANLPANLR